MMDYATILIYIVCICLSASAAGAKRPDSPKASTWWFLEDAQFSEDNGHAVKAKVLTVDTTKAKLRIASVPFELESLGKRSDASLRSFAKAVAGNPALSGKELIFVNGGFSSFRVDVPIGLLIVNGNVYSTTETEYPEERINILNDIKETNIWNGILCQNKEDKKFEIMHFSKYRPGLCQQALQAGPMLVKPGGTNGISSGEPKVKAPYIRTAICLNNNSDVKLIITLDKTHLFSLAKWLANPKESGGMGCQSALNLSGDMSSGIVIKPPSKKDWTYIGDGSFSIPSAIIIGP